MSVIYNKDLPESGRHLLSQCFLQRVKQEKQPYSHCACRRQDRQVILKIYMIMSSLSDSLHLCSQLNLFLNFLCSDCLTGHQNPLYCRWTLKMKEITKPRRKKNIIHRKALTRRRRWAAADRELVHNETQSFHLVGQNSFKTLQGAETLKHLV